MQEDNSLKISRILHAGYIFETNLATIAFDPIFESRFSQNCYAFPNVEFDGEAIASLRFSAVFISHFHDDHCSLVSLNKLNKSTPIYIFCLHIEIISLIKELGFKEIYLLSIDCTVTVGNFQVTPRRALNEAVDCLFQICANGLSVLNVVDALIDDDIIAELSYFAPWDLVLWPFQTLRETDILCPSRATPADTKLPEEWINQIQALNPRYIVPSSCQFIHEDWSWYNHALFPISYAQFSREMSEYIPKTQVIRLNPSQSMRLARTGTDEKCELQWDAPVSWIKTIGDQDVDYTFRPYLVATKTSEISQKFFALDDQAQEFVLDYCRVGLIEKFNLIGGSPDIYFNKKRVWLLSLFNESGFAQHFYYLLDLDVITLIKEDTHIPNYFVENEPVAWCTELPIQKLFGALASGETLPSLYFRINDSTLDQKIEREIADVDVLQDPLIRCLFSEDVSSYQRAQLRAIKSKV